MNKLVPLVAAWLFMLASISHSMTFDVVNIGRQPTIVGHGRIVHGDADRLKTVLTARARDKRGNYQLTLHSPGGNVDAAFELAKVIEEKRIQTYVGVDEECVSACAAVVFLAGHKRAVLGRVGFHGCYSIDTKLINTNCNERVAQHAVKHGVDYAVIMSLIEDVPHNEIVWFDYHESTCWNISYHPDPMAGLPLDQGRCIKDAIRSAIRGPAAVTPPALWPGPSGNLIFKDFSDIEPYLDRAKPTLPRTR